MRTQMGREPRPGNRAGQSGQAFQIGEADNEETFDIVHSDKIAGDEFGLLPQPVAHLCHARRDVLPIYPWLEGDAIDDDMHDLNSDIPAQARSWQAQAVRVKGKEWATDRRRWG